MIEKKSLFFKSLAVVLALCLVFVTVQRVHANTRGVVGYGSKGIKVGIPGLQLTSEETAPTDAGLADGRLYYDTTDGLQVRTGGVWKAVAYGAVSGNTLDQAYDQGGPGAGSKINADTNVVEIEVIDGSNNGALLLDMKDTSNNPDVLTITNTGSGADIVAPSYSVTAGAVVAQTSVTTAAVVAYGAGADSNLAIDAKGTGTVTISATSTGVVTIVPNLELTGDLDINGNDLTSAGDLVITPGGGQVDFSVADIAVDGGKKIGLNGIGSLGNDFIILTGSNIVIDATADIVLDPAGADVDIDAADLWIDGGFALSLDGSAASNTITFSTNLNIVASADILLDPAGGDVDIDAADLQLDTGKKLSLNGATETDAIYSSTDLQIVSANDIILTPTGAQVGIIAADLSVAGGKKIGLNAIAGLANDFLYLSTNVILDAAADIVLDPGGGQVDVDAADLAVDSGKKIGFNGIASLANDFISYDGTDIIIDAAADIKLNGAVSVDVGAALTVATTAVFTGSITVNGAQIIGDGVTELIGVRRPATVSSSGTVTVTAALSGTIFYNDQATEFDLPADPTGLVFTFVVNAASNLYIDPNGTDRFPSPITDANGDRLLSSTIGDSITIVGIDANTWYILSTYPASTDWTDGN